MDNLIPNYKEYLTNKSDKKRTYFFSFKSNLRGSDHTISGYYIIDEFDNKWMSVDAISDILTESKYEPLRSKHFDINHEKQNLFYTLEFDQSLIKKDDHKFLANIIRSNLRQGTPRRFLTNSRGDKINIEMDISASSEIDLIF